MHSPASNFYETKRELRWGSPMLIVLTQGVISTVYSTLRKFAE